MVLSRECGVKGIFRGERHDVTREGVSGSWRHERKGLWSIGRNEKGKEKLISFFSHFPSHNGALGLRCHFILNMSQTERNTSWYSQVFLIWYFCLIIAESQLKNVWLMVSLYTKQVTTGKRNRYKPEADNVIFLSYFDFFLIPNI